MGLLIFLDVVVGALLVATIGYCILLNRKLTALRRNEAELRTVLGQFADAAARAEAGVALLKKAGREAATSLTDRISEARAMRDDLAFVTERGDRMFATLKDRLERPKPAKPQGTSANGTEQRTLSRSERELRAAIEAAR